MNKAQVIKRIKAKLTEASKSVEFMANNWDDYKKKMAKLSMDGQCWTGSVVFGMVYATAYQQPSKIPYTAVGDSPLFLGSGSVKGYWQNGQLHPFPQSLVDKYESTGISSQ